LVGRLGIRIGLGLGGGFKEEFIGPNFWGPLPGQEGGTYFLTKKALWIYRGQVIFQEGRDF